MSFCEGRRSHDVPPWHAQVCRVIALRSLPTSLRTLEFEIALPSALGARKREDRPGDIRDNDQKTQQAERPHWPYPQHKADDEADEAGENQGEDYLPSDVSEHGPSSCLCVCGWPSTLHQALPCVLTALAG